LKDIPGYLTVLKIRKGGTKEKGREKKVSTHFSLWRSRINTGLTRASLAFQLRPLSVSVTSRGQCEHITIEPVAGHTAICHASVVRCGCQRQPLGINCTNWRTAINRWNTSHCTRGS